MPIFFYLQLRIPENEENQRGNFATNLKIRKFLLEIVLNLVKKQNKISITTRITKMKNIHGMGGNQLFSTHAVSLL